MAALYATRHWDSDDSGDSALLNFARKSVSSRWKWPEDQDTKNSGPANVNQGSRDRAITTRVQPLTKKKGFKSVSRITVLAKPKQHVADSTSESPSKVKPSALLYEITERTNQLAQPRIRVASEDPVAHRVKISQIPKPTARILELSLPRVTYEPWKKPDNYVSPKALRAVATERIIELSRPKKVQYSKPPRRRKKLSFSRRRWPVNSHVVLSNYITSRNNMNQLNRLKRGLLRAKMRRLKRTRFDDEHKNRRGGKKRRTVKKSRGCLATRSSDRSVIMINLNFSGNSRGNCQSKRSRKAKRVQLRIKDN